MSESSVFMGARRRRRYRCAMAAASTVAVAAAMMVVAAPAQAATKPITVQVSVPTGGFDPGNGGSGGDRDTERRLVSDDGRYVVFESTSQLVPGQGQLDRQIVKRDRKLGTTTLISKSSTGKKGNRPSTDPSMSANGRYIVFTSGATNLVTGDTNSANDVFLHDSVTGKTTRISVSSTGAQGSGGGSNSGPASISANGKFVTFLSYASGLASGDEDGQHAYVRDISAGTTELVSYRADGAVTYAFTSTSISADGRYVLFASDDPKIDPPRTQFANTNILLRDRTLGTTRMIGNYDHDAFRATISADGRYAAFQSEEALAPGDANGTMDIYVQDLTSSAGPVLVSRTASGAAGNKESRWPAISADGRYIAFQSSATNLVSGDTNDSADIFRYDTKTGTTVRVSVANSGAQGAESSYRPSISGNGQHIVFESYTRNLTKVNTATWQQVFVRDLAGKWPALFAKSAALPKKVGKNSTFMITTKDIAKNQQLQVTWKPVKGKTIKQTVTVKGNAFTLSSPKKTGTYAVTVNYGDHVLRSRSITVVKSSATALPKTVKKGKKLAITARGLAAGTAVKVQYKPMNGVKAKAATYSAKVNAKGTVTVPTAKAGSYLVSVKAKGALLRSASVRLR